MPNKIYTYQNFNVDINGEVLPIMVWGIWAGVLIAIVMALALRTFTGTFVKRIKLHGATSEAHAKTLSELGISAIVASFFLTDTSSVLRYIKIANPDEADLANSVNGKKWKFAIKIMGRSYSFKTAKFYLPEENRIGAETRYPEEAHPLRSFVIAVVILTVGAVFAAYALPELLLMLDNFISMT